MSFRSGATSDSAFQAHQFKENCEGLKYMPEHWDFYCSSPLLGRYILHSRGIEKYKASSDLVVQNVKSDVIYRKVDFRFYQRTFSIKHFLW